MTLAPPPGRLSRAIGVAGWVVTGGAVVLVVSAAALALVAGSPVALLRPSVTGLGPAAAIGALLSLGGAIVAIVGIVAYVFLGGLSPELARRGYGSFRLAVAIVAAGAIVGALIALPPLLLTGQFSSRLAGGSGGLSPTGLALGILASQIGLFVALWWRVLRPGVLTLAAMGLRPERFGRDVAIGLATGLASFAILAITQAALRLGGIEQTQQATFGSVTNAAPIQFALILLGGAVLAPIVEEMLFRGFAFRSIQDRQGVAAGFFYSALLFAIVHFNGPAGLPIFAIGLLLAYVYWRTGSLVPSMIAHAFNNGVALTAVYLAGS